MINFPAWLEPAQAKLGPLIEQGRLPHALLIHGPCGTGRRLLALWIAGRVLGIDSLDLQAGLGAGRVLDPDRAPSHPDLRLFQLEEDKRDITVDSMRALIAFIHLTSHRGGAKVAFICPAEAMNRNAENSLLKTLEEPPAHSLIILVADSISRLAPTVVSRCHRERISMPSMESAETWLQSLDPTADWRLALELAGGAPIGALQIQQSDFPKQAMRFEKDISALMSRRSTPVEVARRWSTQDKDLCLRWLYQRVSSELRDSHLQMNGNMLSMEHSYGYLREINELRRLQRAGLNAEMQLTNLLTRWYGGVGVVN